MRQYAAERNLSPEQLEYLPQTFVLRPGAGAAQGADERAQFLREFAAIQARADGEKNVWIVKANRGAKGATTQHHTTGTARVKRRSMQRLTLRAHCGVTDFAAPFFVRVALPL